MPKQADERQQHNARKIDLALPELVESLRRAEASRQWGKIGVVFDLQGGAIAATHWLDKKTEK